MKRILMLLSVVALMVVMLAMSVTPAFAAWYETFVPGVFCRTGGNPYFITGVGDPYLLKLNRNGDDWLCYAYPNNPNSTDFRYYDNR